MRRPWRTSSRGLALERGANHVGLMTASAVTALEALGVRATDAVTPHQAPVTTDELERADQIVTVTEAEHLPLLKGHFLDWAERASSGIWTPRRRWP
jgi:hypothetical protein